MANRRTQLAPLALLGVLLAAATGVLAQVPVAGHVQPAVGERGLVLTVEPTRSGGASRAWVDSADGDRTRIRLRRGETLTTIAETRSGFVVAGARESREGTLELVVMRELAGRVTRLDNPGGARTILQVRPALLTDERDLAGVAWLEGDGLRSLSVRAAGWTGVDWKPAEVISVPGPGSQTGLVGTVLGDGSRLLVWAAYDGEDDELTWSLGDEGDWSPPRRLTANRVPDITPTVIRIGEDVVLAWARMHGSGYRVMTSRFSPESGWSAARPMGGPDGFLPEFLSLGERTFLVWRSAWPRAWAVAEMQGSRASRQSLIPEASESRPALFLGDRDEVKLRWAGVDREETAVWEVRP